MTESTRKVLDDPYSTSAMLTEEAERLRATLAVVEQQRAAKAKAEADKAQREAEAQREQEAADADATREFDDVVQAMRKLLPGADALAPAVDEALARHAARVAPFVAAPGADVDAISNRILWSHPLAQLLPLLDMLRGDGPAPERR
jgi:hypothetical protein